MYIPSVYTPSFILTALVTIRKRSKAFVFLASGGELMSQEGAF